MSGEAVPAQEHRVLGGVANRTAPVGAEPRLANCLLTNAWSCAPPARCLLGNGVFFLLETEKLRVSAPWPLGNVVHSRTFGSDATALHARKSQMNVLGH